MCTSHQPTSGADSAPGCERCAIEAVPCRAPRMHSFDCGCDHRRRAAERMAHTCGVTAPTPEQRQARIAEMAGEGIDLTELDRAMYGPMPAASPDLLRCTVCGELLTERETRIIRSDLDFVRHGPDDHYVGTVLP